MKLRSSRKNAFSFSLKTSVLSLALLTSSAYATQFTSINELELADRPISQISKQVSTDIPMIRANALDVSALLKEDKLRAEQNLPFRFAVPLEYEGNLKSLGKWEIGEEQAVYRLSLSASNAKSLSLGLKNLFLPKGTKLFFYNSDLSTVVGPYTHKSNKAHKELWTPVIEADLVTLEINVPVKLKEQLTFDFAQVNLGYRGIKTHDMAKSGSCNIDVVCSQGDAWRNEIRSVARYTITNSQGTFLCTGSLVNNTSGNRRPLFLTANHCGINSQTDSSLVIYWNYETSACGGTPDGQLNQFQNGTRYLASSAPSDFAIAELDENPNSSFNVHYAGWDAADVAPGSAVAIHHPSGDEKRISLENDPLTITNYSSNTEISNGTHLRVSAWDEGTTEGGSSGSGLWNAAHRIVGTLHGGGASCDATTESDWYGRMAVHWEGGGTPNTQAKFWLDPSNSGATQVDGIDDCTRPTVSITTAPTTGEINQSLNFVGTASGTSGTYQYEWDFNDDGIIDSTESNPAFSYGFLYQGNVRLRVTDGNSCSGSDSSAITISNSGNELFPVSDQMPTGWTQPSGANAGWSVNNSTVFEGSYSLKADTITDSQTASVEMT
ncbi:MAG: PKD domain-containing protein, partial [Kangiellaceae bacterium]|nr:PKD domain-containing protein [Kangiellaceae bacterium]